MHDNGYWLAVVLVYVALKEVQNLQDNSMMNPLFSRFFTK
jgi:hypothetical protein